MVVPFAGTEPVAKGSAASYQFCKLDTEAGVNLLVPVLDPEAFVAVITTIYTVPGDRPVKVTDWLARPLSTDGVTAEPLRVYE